jgi:hypothetical protein
VVSRRRSLERTIVVKEYKLKNTIGSHHEVDPDDVWVVKQALRREGLYSEPSHGITPYPDGALVDAIKEFQSRNGLRADGVIKPGGETELRMRPLLLAAATHKCMYCGAWHGGVYAPNVCWQCWHKGYR